MNVATRWTFGLLVPFATSCSWILDLPPPVDDHCRDDDGTLNCYETRAAPEHRVPQRLFRGVVSRLDARLAGEGPERRTSQVEVRAQARHLLVAKPSASPREPLDLPRDGRRCDGLTTDERTELERWCRMLRWKRLEPLQHSWRMLVRHEQGVLAWARHRMTNAALEGNNARVRVLRHRADGYRNPDHLIVILYHASWRQPLASPRSATHPNAR